MKLTELEAEQLRHLNTRDALVNLQASLVAQDRQRAYNAIATRLGFEGDFTIATDGTVTPSAAPTETPP